MCRHHAFTSTERLVPRPEPATQSTPLTQEHVARRAWKMFMQSIDSVSRSSSIFADEDVVKLRSLSMKYDHRGSNRDLRITSMNRAP